MVNVKPFNRMSPRSGMRVCAYCVRDTACYISDKHQLPLTRGHMTKTVTMTLTIDMWARILLCELWEMTFRWIPTAAVHLCRCRLRESMIFLFTNGRIRRSISKLTENAGHEIAGHDITQEQYDKWMTVSKTSIRSFSFRILQFYARPVIDL